MQRQPPSADQAAFAAANVLLDLKEYGPAAAACERYALRYPKSTLLDNYWYLTGYCRFVLGQPQAALEMCRKVAEHTSRDPASGEIQESPNKWQAIFILGQIYHSQGQAEEAIREYRRVEDRFLDARQSIDYLLGRRIALPELTTLRPGKAVELELKFRNIANCDARVYRIDLLQFGLLQGDLSGITRINVSGIHPQYEAALPLGDGKDFRDRTAKLALPLKDEGAYLVVCRGGDLHASGLVLITPLAIEVRNEAAEDEVRTIITDAQSGRYLRDVQVRVIGRGNDDFISGQTDLRGMFLAKGVEGAPTVVAQAGPGRYAFFRGTAPRGLAEEIAASQPQPRPHARPRRGRAVPQRQAAGAVPAPGPSAVSQATVSHAVDMAGLSPTEVRKRIDAALDSPTRLEFTDTPLSDVVEFLKGYHRIEIQLDKKALDDVGVAPDVPVTVNLRGVTLRAALKQILHGLGLAFDIENEVLTITTPETAETHLETVVYPVADLLGAERTGERREMPAELAADLAGAHYDFDTLIELITSTVKPTTWDSVGGPASVAPFEHNLSIVVSQTQEVHAEIAKLLAELRRVGGLQRALGYRLPTARRAEGVAGPMGMGGGMGGAMGGMGGGMGGAMGGMGGGMGGAVGGMGGAMGGMGGGGAFGGAPPGAVRHPARGARPAAPQEGEPEARGPRPSEDSDLLRGVQDSNRRNQNEQVGKLRGMYQNSGKGVKGGGVF